MAKILAIVGKDRIFGCTMRRLLVISVQGLHIECFSDGQCLLEALNDGKKFDVVLMDYTLEGEKPGVWYASQIAKHYPQVKVIGFSYGNLWQEAFMLAGAIDFISKDASLEFKLKALAEILNG